MILRSVERMFCAPNAPEPPVSGRRPVIAARLIQAIAAQLRITGANSRHLEYVENHTKRLLRINDVPTRINRYASAPMDRFQPERDAWITAAKGCPIWWAMSPVMDGKFNTHLFHELPKSSERWPICIDLTSMLEALSKADRLRLVRRLKSRALFTKERLVRHRPKSIRPALRKVAKEWPGKQPELVSRRARPKLDWARTRPPPFTFEMAHALLMPHRRALKRLLTSKSIVGKRKERKTVVSRLNVAELDAMMEELATDVALSGHLYSELDLAASRNQQHANFQALLQLKRILLRQLYQLDGATFSRIMIHYPGGELAINRNGLDLPLLRAAVITALVELGTPQAHRPVGTAKRYRQQLALSLANIFAHHRGEIIPRVGYKPPRARMRDYQSFVAVVFKALPWRLRSYKIGRSGAKDSIALAKEGLKQRKLAIERVYESSESPRPERLGTIDPANWRM